MQASEGSGELCAALRSSTVAAVNSPQQSKHANTPNVRLASDVECVSELLCSIVYLFIPYCHNGACGIAEAALSDLAYRCCLLLVGKGSGAPLLGPAETNSKGLYSPSFSISEEF